MILIFLMSSQVIDVYFSFFKKSNEYKLPLLHYQYYLKWMFLLMGKLFYNINNVYTTKLNYQEINQQINT